ncbi:helix-turn-helix transcriptional regulator [Paracoccus sp. S3-43]|uniref:ArsR/SmtB family transcription factor n=1 Tax=Paracoccus sp. S3-43 TaxID=3030011 RepID=UPI0023AEC7FC|nr:helix-turn-helix transcriptional regulator [Paracoccus sp. S3-43]WEF23960.1 helix-turn-helix transcriptional regulator [Paracoccus sp. S3-43]
MSDMDDDDKVFRALAAPVRRRIMDALRDRPQTTGELAATLTDIGRCAVMQHLGVLEGAGIVVVRRVGRQRWNHLDAIPIKRIHDRWIGEYARSAVERLDDLKHRIEKPEEATVPGQVE